MKLFEDTNPKTLKGLLGQIHSREMALPDFQRDFVWQPSATQELIVSIANSYPAGSLLRVRDTKRVFRAREFEGAPPLDGHKHTYLILDGQQRLTSLYQAFYGVGEHRFYLDLNKLMEDQDFEDSIFNVRATTKWVQNHQTFDLQAKELILPLDVLQEGAVGFSRWTRQVARRLEGQARIDLEDRLDELQEQWIDAVDDYEFPVVSLAEETEADAICTIFETLNRTGVKLNVFELLTARFWSLNIYLRELWDRAQVQYPIIEDFGVDPYYILQGIALGSREMPSCKRGDVLNLKSSDIEEWWDKVVAGLAQGLEILRDDCGVVVPRWLPYQTLLSPLAAVLARTDMPKTPEAGARREKLGRWFWCSVFSQAYESSPNSQSAKDVTELVRWLDGGEPPETVEEMHFDPKTLREVTPRQRAIYRGTICLILSSGVRDFHTRSVITGKLVDEQGIDDHHVFPSDFLKTYKGIAEPRSRDCVLNRTLIDRTTNQVISNRAPSDYMREIRDTAGFPFENVLDSHNLPSGETSPLWRDDYQEFLDFRQERLWQEVQRVTGVMEASDLEAETEAA